MFPSRHISGKESRENVCRGAAKPSDSHIQTHQSDFWPAQPLLVERGVTLAAGDPLWRAAVLLYI